MQGNVEQIHLYKYLERHTEPVRKNVGPARSNADVTRASLDEIILKSPSPIRARAEDMHRRERIIFRA